MSTKKWVFCENTRYNYFPLLVHGDLAPRPDYFFFFFFAAFFFVAIERLLEFLGPDSDPVIFLMSLNQVTFRILRE